MTYNADDLLLWISINRHGTTYRVIAVGLMILIIASLVWLITSLAKHHISSITLVVVFISTSILLIIALFAVQYVGTGLKNADGGNNTQFFDCIYFAVVTWTTLGYGDLLPVSRAARWWAMIEVLTGYAIMSLVIAVLVVVLGRSPRT